MATTTYDPILEIRALPRIYTKIVPPRLGTALVLQGNTGTPLVVNVGDRLPPKWRGRYRWSYLVDIAEHQLRFEEQLPSKDPAFTFQCTMTMTCRVIDPARVVAQHIHDAAAELRAPIVHFMKAGARAYGVFELRQAERTITELLQEEPGPLAGHKIFRSTRCLVELTVNNLEVRSGEEYQRLLLDEFARLQNKGALERIPDILAYSFRSIDTGTTSWLLEIEAKRVSQAEVDSRKELLAQLLSPERYRNLSPSRLESLRQTVDALQHLPIHSEASHRQLLQDALSVIKDSASSISEQADWADTSEWPVYIYLSDDSGEVGERIGELLQGIWQELGFELVAEGAPVLGSFFQRLRAKATSPEAQQALHERLMKLERAAEVRAVSVPESLANMQNAQALAAVVQALKGETSAAIALGPLLVLKTSHANGTSTVYSKMLTTGELRALERRPELLKDPDTLLLLLSPSPLGEPEPAKPSHQPSGETSPTPHSGYEAVISQLLRPERPTPGSLTDLNDEPPCEPPPRLRPPEPRDPGEEPHPRAGP